MVEDFALPPDGRDFAVAQGFPPGEIQAIADDFARHYLASTDQKARSANWRATWQRWVCREAQFRRDRAAQTADKGGPSTGGPQLSGILRRINARG